MSEKKCFTVQLEVDKYQKLSKNASKIGLKFVDYARLIFDRELAKEVILNRFLKAKS